MEPTGIRNLDRALGGGLSLPSANALIGPLGCGKTALGRQLVANYLAQGYAAMYYAIDAPMEDCKNALEALGVDTDRYIETGQLYFVDMFSKGVERLGAALTSGEDQTVLKSGFSFSDLVEMGRGFTTRNLNKKQFGFMDSITPLFLTANRAEVYQYCQTLKFATRFANAIGIAVLHDNVLDEETRNAFLGFADGIIAMSRKSEFSGKEVVGGGFLKIIRMKDQKFSANPLYYSMEREQLLISDMPVIL